MIISWNTFQNVYLLPPLSPPASPYHPQEVKSHSQVKGPEGAFLKSLPRDRINAPPPPGPALFFFFFRELLYQEAGLSSPKCHCSESDSEKDVVCQAELGQSIYQRDQMPWALPLVGRWPKSRQSYFYSFILWAFPPLKCIRMSTESAQLSFLAVVFGFLLNIRPHHAVGQPRHWLSLSRVAPWPVLRGEHRK